MFVIAGQRIAASRVEFSRGTEGIEARAARVQRDIFLSGTAIMVVAAT